MLIEKESLNTNITGRSNGSTISSTSTTFIVLSDNSLQIPSKSLVEHKALSDNLNNNNNNYNHNCLVDLSHKEILISKSRTNNVTTDNSDFVSITKSKSNIDATFTTIPLNDNLDFNHKIIEFNGLDIDELLSNFETIKTEIIDSDSGNNSEQCISQAFNEAKQDIENTSNNVIISNFNEEHNEKNICTLFMRKIFCWNSK